MPVSSHSARHSVLESERGFTTIPVVAWSGILRGRTGGGVRAEECGHRRQSRPKTRPEILCKRASPHIRSAERRVSIAWTINSVCAIAGAVHVLNLPRETQGRSEFLRLQGAAWALFTSFDAAYFGLRSPINAAAVTLLYSAAAAASFNVAARRLRDPFAAISLAPTLAWLMLANPVGITQALWNRDAFWKTGPSMQPNRRWLK